MTLDTSSLRGLGTKKAKTSGRPPWQQPVFADIGQGRVLAFDQSLGGCAAVALIRTVHDLTVYATQSFKTAHVAQGGHEENFQKAQDLTRQVAQWIQDTIPYPPEWVVVHEMPPVGGGQLRRPESSIMAAMAVRYAATSSLVPLAPMVAKKAHAKFFCGNPNATKKDHHAALMDVVSPWPVVGLHQVTNEGKRDALSVGLTHLARH